MSKRLMGLFTLVIVILFSSSCQSATPMYIDLGTPTAAGTPVPLDATASPTMAVASTQGTAAGSPAMKPADVVPLPEEMIYDVRSARKSAPYGDSYNLNRLERPFMQDMRYVPDLDIVSFNISEDSDWYYVSIQLAGNNPNNQLGIDYGVELDLNADGFGDTLIWAYPPYGTDWTTNWVQVYNDTNHDTAGKSSSKADVGGNGDGYETMVFDGKLGKGDPGLAWVRMQEGSAAVVQFAFKKSLAGATFLFGVVADGGLKDPSKFDYNDHFKEADAGSPLKNDMNYPLKALYAVDNTCWQAYGMKNPYNIGKVCPAELSATATANIPQTQAVLDGKSTPVSTSAAAASPTSYP